MVSSETLRALQITLSFTLSKVGAAEDSEQRSDIITQVLEDCSGSCVENRLQEGKRRNRDELGCRCRAPGENQGGRGGGGQKCLDSGSLLRTESAVFALIGCK